MDIVLLKNVKFCGSRSSKCLPPPPSESQTPLRPFKKLNRLTQFLENDRKVLRFRGIWHDGLDKRHLSLLYFLAGKIPSSATDEVLLRKYAPGGIDVKAVKRS